MISPVEVFYNTADLAFCSTPSKQHRPSLPPKNRYLSSLDLKVRTDITYSKPEVFFSSFILFSGTLLPLNHFLVAENSDRLKPFLDINCKGILN